LDALRILDERRVAYLDLTGQRQRKCRAPAGKRAHDVDVLQL